MSNNGRVEGLRRGAWVYHYWASGAGQGFPGGSVVKNPPAQAGDIRDVGSTPGSGRFSGEGHGNPLQSSSLENPMGRGAWWAIVHGVAVWNMPEVRVAEWNMPEVTERAQGWVCAFHFLGGAVRITWDDRRGVTILKVKVAQSCLTLCEPMDIVRGILQARILEWCSRSLLQGIFPTQGSNPGLPHCGQIRYQLSHKGNPFLKVLLKACEKYFP